MGNGRIGVVVARGPAVQRAESHGFLPPSVPNPIACMNDHGRCDPRCDHVMNNRRLRVELVVFLQESGTLTLVVVLKLLHDVVTFIVLRSSAIWSAS
jgi:hypothetical protein